MDFGDVRVTKREVLVTISITMILIMFGFIISNQMKNKINEKNEKYFKSLKIENNNEQFKYAINTNIGYTLAQGKVEAIEPVSKDIAGQYLYIQKVKEKYTMHTRKVAHTRRVGNKTETYYTTEEYWTWDYVGKEECHVNRFRYLGVEFEYGTINFHNTEYKETIRESDKIRYKYYVIPSEFQGVLFSNIKNNTINENEFYHNRNIQTIVEIKEKEATSTVVGFWIAWIIFVGIIDFIYVCFDNDYLEEKRNITKKGRKTK